MDTDPNNLNELDIQGPPNDDNGSNRKISALEMRKQHRKQARGDLEKEKSSMQSNSDMSPDEMKSNDLYAKTEKLEENVSPNKEQFNVNNQNIQGLNEDSANSSILVFPKKEDEKIKNGSNRKIDPKAESKTNSKNISKQVNIAKKIPKQASPVKNDIGKSSYQDKTYYDNSSIHNDLQSQFDFNYNGPTGIEQSQDDESQMENSKGQIKPFKCFDFIFPGGIVSKLVKLEKMAHLSDTWLESILFEKFDFAEPAPVLAVVGARNTGRGNFVVGLARAAFRSDAVILDSGVQTGMELYAIREKVKLVGVFPGKAVQQPKVKSKKQEMNELANGHTHMFSITDPLYKKWGDEAIVKMRIAEM